MFNKLKRSFIMLLTLVVLMSNVWGSNANFTVKQELNANKADKYTSIVLGTCLMGLGLLMANDARDGRKTNSFFWIGFGTFAAGEYFVSKTIFKW
jgi:hypothetical protein